MFLVFTLVAYGMLRSGSVRSSSLLVCLTFWATLVGYLAISGGVSSPAFSLLSLVVIMGTVCSGPRGAVGFGLLAIASGVLLFWLGSNGWLASVEQAPTPARMFATFTVTLVGLTL